MWILAASAEPPLIDIDGTLFVQLVLFLLLLIVLTQLLFKPYLRLRDERQQAIGGTADEARRLEADARTRIAEYEGHLAKAKARGAEERARIRAEGAVRQRDVVDKARAETTRRVTEARAEVARLGEQARVELTRQADDIGRRMASRLLGREVS